MHRILKGTVVAMILVLAQVCMADKDGCGGPKHCPAPPPPPAPSPVTPIQSFSLTPFAVAAGATSTARVVLSSPAPAGGAVVAVEANSAAVGVPASVVVPQGAIEALFPVVTAPGSSGTIATISVSYSGSTKSATLTVQ